MVSRWLRATSVAAQAGALRALHRVGYGVELGRDASATVVILSYKRMQNIGSIVRSALLCRFVDRVVVSNNNPDVDLVPWLRLADPRLQLVQHTERRGPSYRYDVARAHPSDFYLCIDDDVFPSPWQLRHMLRALVDDPSVPRGPKGQNYDAGRNKLTWVGHRGYAWRDRTERVDVIVQIFAFTRAHLDRYFDVLKALGEDNAAIHASEDVILSMTGAGRPFADDIGHLLQCSTGVDPAVALWRQEGADDYRKELFHRVRAVT
jgi:hypothetical protein